MIHPSMLPRGGAERVVMWLCDGLHRRGHEVTLITSDYDEYWGSRSDLSFAVVELCVKGHEWSLDLLENWDLAANRLAPLLASFDVLNPHNCPAYIWAQWARERSSANSSVPIVWYCEEPFRFFYRHITDTYSLRAEQHRASDPLLVAAALVQHVSPRLTLFRRAIRKVKSMVMRAPRRAEANNATLMDEVFAKAEEIDRSVVGRLDMVLTNSRYIASNIEKIFHLSAQPCHLGIPVEDVARSSVSTEPFLLTVSRLTPEKNLDTCLRAVALLRERGKLPFNRFLIAGTGPDDAYLRELVRLLELQDVVEFLGFVSDEDIQDLYRRTAAVMYLPLDETFGLVYLEAAQYWKASIGPTVGGPAELVLDGKSGITVDPLDVAAVAAAITRAFASADEFARMGEAAHGRLVEYFSLEKYVDRFELELAKLMNESPSGAA